MEAQDSGGGQKDTGEDILVTEIQSKASEGPEVMTTKTDEQDEVVLSHSTENTEDSNKTSEDVITERSISNEIEKTIDCVKLDDVNVESGVTIDHQPEKGSIEIEGKDKSSPSSTENSEGSEREIRLDLEPPQEQNSPKTEGLMHGEAQDTVQEEKSCLAEEPIKETHEQEATPASENADRGETVDKQNFDSIVEDIKSPEADLSLEETPVTEVSAAGENASKSETAVLQQFDASVEDIKSPEADNGMEEVNSPESDFLPEKDENEEKTDEKENMQVDEAKETSDTSKVETLTSGDVESCVKERAVAQEAPTGASLEEYVRPASDREDISDDEFDTDLPASEQAPSASGVTGTFDNQEDSVPTEELSLEPISISDSSAPSVSAEAGSGIPSEKVRKIDKGSIHMGDVIDLKYEDTLGKSEENSMDESAMSKGPSDDLEAVSDDELPEAAHTSAVAQVPVNKVLIEGGEEVSSSEDDGPASPDSAFNAAHNLSSVLGDPSGGALSLETSEVSDGNISSSEQTTGHLQKPGEPDILSQDTTGAVSVDLASLEAEPISDEEDLGHEGTGSPIEVEGGEAGEVKSPNDRSPQPVEELLREVEPISADESSDTDGELPSGDEEPNKDEKGNNANFESIESDEEGNVVGPSKSSDLKSSESKAEATDSGLKGENEYMDPISDEENLDEGNKTKSEAGAQSELAQTNDEAASRVLAMEKRQVSTTFNEHHEELDYEENEGEEGDHAKPEEEKETKESKQDDEEGEVDEGEKGDDKDEGELSDDDCEEGEIKEPGSKKMFVKPICRFFQRGHCTWGLNCRFLHPGVNDKGNYQMIEIPGFKPPHPPPGVAPWEEPEEPVELPPPPMPDIPPVETAWERGLRIAKEQRKKASERKEQETDFEEKRLNLSIDEERELNKENERMPKIIPKDPYYDQQAYEEDEYYKISQDPWHTGHYENFEVRYHRDNSFSPPYREKPPSQPPPPPRYSPGHQYSPPPTDKFGRQRAERREPFRPDPRVHEASSGKRPDEWTDPWRRNVAKDKAKPSTRSKSPHKRKGRSHSRGRKAKRSVSDSSNSSRSGSGSSSSSRSSRSGSGSSSSSRSKSPEPAPPGVERHDRYGGHSPPRYGDGPRSAVSVRGRPDRRGGGYNNYDPEGFRGDPRNNRGYGGRFNDYPSNRGDYRGRGGRGGPYGGPPGYPDRGDPRDLRGRDGRPGGRPRGRSPPDRPLPYTRPRPRSASSHSSSSRSGSRSRSRSDSSRSRSSSNSSRSSSSSSSSVGSADSDHLYRDLGSPTKNPRAPGQPAQRKKRTNSHKDRPPRGSHGPSKPGLPVPPSSKYPSAGPPQSPVNLDRIPHPREPKSGMVPPSGRSESKYASRNAPQAPVKAKDPLKVVGQKSNIKLTLLPKQQQSSLGARPNPLDSPPHNKRRASERDTSPVAAPPSKRMALPVPQTSALRIAADKAAKLQARQADKSMSSSSSSAPMPPSSSSTMSTQRAKAPVSPQKQPVSSKSRAPPEPAVAKAAPKVAPSGAAPAAMAAPGGKAKKSMSSRREELLKQLKAVEDAIARKKLKL